jgi:hypothetical protein
MTAGATRSPVSRIAAPPPRLLLRPKEPSFIFPSLRRNSLCRGPVRDHGMRPPSPLQLSSGKGRDGHAVVRPMFPRWA